MKSQEAAIGEAFGEPLAWDELVGKKGCRISVKGLEADPSDESDWPRQYAWALDRVERFYNAFSVRIRNLADAPMAELDHDAD